ncbi:transporter substrate-binding domain-containing protein [Bifidobacterium reuteri]|uniref:Transporter substrate-binding domain-containing protein n=1 Tax=Bifidobacterium reuteri TaxID=983706 RepID=A0A5J5EA40_9BIFI|nr:transporter substrate-binding domain-containing protein [Bifidobacterium reuteri]
MLPPRRPIPCPEDGDVQGHDAGRAGAARPVRRRMRRHVIRAAAVASGMVALLSGCGQIQVTAVSGAPEGPTIAIGVAADEPGVSAWHDGTYEGFDVTVAKYVASRLGYANKQIVFKQVRPENRQSMLDSGQVDLVVASWAITDESRAAVDFAGPYLTTGVGLLVRAEDRTTLSADGDSVGELGRRNICVVKGDETASMLLENHSDAVAQERDSYAQCVTALEAGSADAIASDQVVLAGLRQANGPQYSALLTDAGTVSYGIAVGKGNARLAGTIAQSLKDMVADGSWDDARSTLENQTKLEISRDGTPDAIVSDDE